MEDARIVYGRLLESIHISGYTRERAIGELKHLLNDNNWKKAGEFFKYSDFIKSLNLGEFKFSIEQRKEIIDEIKRIESEEDKISQRSLAGVLGVTQPTIREDLGLTERNLSRKKNNISDFEADTNINERNLSSPQKSWFEKDGQKVAEREQKNIHVGNNSGENEWYTPSYIIEAARKTMRSIDLDPATSLKANEIIKAKKIFTSEDNGLIQNWAGNIWLNPPYSQPLISEFSEKVIDELPNINQICVLVNNATETNWFQNILSVCNAVCFL